MASYPSSIATFTAVTDTTGTLSTGTTDHATITNQVNNEVVAIETTLGINAQGTDGTVAAKLVRIDGQSSGTGYVPTTFQLNGVALAGTSATLGSAALACIGIGALSTDGSMISDSNNLVPSQKAVVTYVAAQVTSGGTVTGVTSANTDIQVASPTTAPVLTLNSGTAASQIVKLTAGGVMPAVAAGSMTALASLATSGTVATATSFSITSGISAGVRYQLILNLVQNGTNGTQTLQFNADSGSNYSGSYCYAGGGTISASATNTSPVALSATASIATASYTQFYINFQTAQGNSNNVVCSYFGGGSGISGSNSPESLFGWYLYTGASALTSVKVVASAGSMSGSWALYQFV